MFNGTQNYSLSDIAAVTDRRGGGFGDGDNAWWIILLFLLDASVDFNDKDKEK